MSSKMLIPTKCQHCNKIFTAKTTVTRYCSLPCARTAYKYRKREKKINSAKNHLSIQLNSLDSPIPHQKEYMSVIDVANVLGISRFTVYRYMKASLLQGTKVLGKTFIRKSNVEGLFRENMTENNHQPKDKAPITEFYTMDEICAKYGYKKNWIFRLTKEKKTPKVLHRGRNHYSKVHIDRLFIKKQPDPAIVEWYTVKELQTYYGMSLQAIYSFAYNNHIPRKKAGRYVFYSKLHFDVARGSRSPQQLYYTTKEAMDKFNLTRESLYYQVKVHRIPKEKCGRYIRISRPELDRIFNLQINQ